MNQLSQHTRPPCWTSFPSRSPQGAGESPLCWGGGFSLVTYCIHTVYMSVPTSPATPAPPALVSRRWFSTSDVYFCFVTKRVCTVFSDSTCAGSYPTLILLFPPPRLLRPPRTGPAASASPGPAGAPARALLVPGVSGSVVPDLPATAPSLAWPAALLLLLLLCAPSPGPLLRVHPVNTLQGPYSPPALGKAV